MTLTQGKSGTNCDSQGTQFQWGWWSQTMFAMALKLKLFSHANAYARLKLIGSCKCVEGDTYANSYYLLNIVLYHNILECYIVLYKML